MNSPHVVDVYDINTDPDGCLMVMELVEGESVDARLRREGSFRQLKSLRRQASDLPNLRPRALREKRRTLGRIAREPAIEPG